MIANFTFEKVGIIELLEANMNDRDIPLHLNRVSGDDGVTTIKNKSMNENGSLLPYLNQMNTTVILLCSQMNS